MLSDDESEGKYRPLTHLRYSWDYCRKKAGVPNIRIHDLRHIAATDLYEAGNAERAIMDIAGWKTTMLSTYRNKNSLRSAQKMVFSPQVTTTVTNRYIAAHNVDTGDITQTLRLAAV